MSGYTKTNVGAAPDWGQDRGHDGLEGRFLRTLTEAEQVGIGFFRFDSGVRFPFGHRHKAQEEVYVVVEGSGRMKLDDDTVELARWDVVRVAPHVGRGLEAGPDGLTVIVAGGPRPDSGDGEPVPDFWPADA